jgi:hypothetical protein
MYVELADLARKDNSKHRLQAFSPGGGPEDDAVLA